MHEISAHFFEVMTSIEREIEGVVFHWIFDYLFAPKHQKIDLVSCSPLFRLLLLSYFFSKLIFKVSPSNFAFSR